MRGGPALPTIAGMVQQQALAPSCNTVLLTAGTFLLALLPAKPSLGRAGSLSAPGGGRVG